MSNLHRRGPWSQMEDQYLMSLVHNQGALNWVRIAQQLGSRTPKQCRERYHQNLKPTLNHEPINPEEGRQIEQLVMDLGKRWAEIARRLHGRSDNAVKNWWNGSQNRRKRVDRRKVSPGYPVVYEGRNEACFSRPTLAIPRALPPLLRQAPPPLSPGFNRQFDVETPLPSPSAHSPSAESFDMAPSLMSDSGSCYTTSPRTTASHPCSPIELPPLKNLGPQSPEYSHSPADTRLPGLSDLTGPLLVKPDYRQGAPSMLHPGDEYHSPRSHLLTAPNSPVNLPSLRFGFGSEEQSEEKDARFNVQRLLN